MDRLRQGRRLVITGDHGYADASSFSNEEKDENTVKLLRSFFGASRCAKEDPAKPWPRQHLPPLGLPAQRLAGRHGAAQVDGPGRLPEPVPPRSVAFGSSGSRSSSIHPSRCSPHGEPERHGQEASLMPNQISLPGVELDDQGKFGFAKPGGVQAKKPRKSNGQAEGRRRPFAAEPGQAGESQRAGFLQPQAAEDLPGSRFSPRADQRPLGAWRETPASRSTR